jgi:hypothetical protein
LAVELGNKKSVMDLKRRGNFLGNQNSGVL